MNLRESASKCRSRPGFRAVLVSRFVRPFGHSIEGLWRRLPRRVGSRWSSLHCRMSSLFLPIEYSVRAGVWRRKHSTVRPRTLFQYSRFVRGRKPPGSKDTRSKSSLGRPSSRSTASHQYSLEVHDDGVEAPVRETMERLNNQGPEPLRQKACTSARVGALG